MTFQEQAFQIGSSPNNNWQRCYMINLQHVPDVRRKLMTLGEDQIAAVFPLSAHIGVKLPLLLSHTGT